MLGPPLRTGQRYTLVVGMGMIDAYGRPLRDGFNKSFSVSEPVREPIAVEEWKIRPPAMDSRESLQLTFPRPLDWARHRSRRNPVALHAGRTVAKGPL